ncbi:FAD-dependent oxidoreductase [Haloglomus halophilum]|uniref:FAD-dependent oxidoreductase n=1 Tax=Haloglomus halophilum TaxID=2962672 RepID=UPI0020C9C8BC|nr:FAD-dependent oxidoreductase [Haloglomus halophilum]
MSETFVVIGGDAAGMSAASKAKRENPDLDIVVFEKGEWVSYAACGMPYYVKDEIEELEDLVQVTAEEFREERDIDLRTGHEVVGIDPEARTVRVEGDGETFDQPYDQLLIATGAHAIEPPFDGIDLDGVFTIHDMDHADAIQDYVTEAEPQTAAIVGGGYVGIEMAEALDERGLEVHMYEMLPHVLQPFGESVATVVEDHLREQDIHLHLDTAVQGFTGDGAVDGVALEAETVPADIVVVGVGVAPNTALAEDAGIEVGETGAIATDAYGRTNFDRIYAAGDCAEAHNVVTDAPDHVPLALTANRAGRAIGQTVTGTPTEVGGMAGTAIVKAFDIGAARTGLTDEEQARDAGFDPVSVEIQASSRAHYYPGAEELTVMLMADRESGRVIGASIVGREGVKRIDTVATALHGGMTVEDVENLDLAYAPPFSPVWDPVATAARVLSGKVD